MVQFSCGYFEVGDFQEEGGGYEFVFFCLGMVEICSVGLGGLLFRISM